MRGRYSAFHTVGYCFDLWQGLTVCALSLITALALTAIGLLPDLQRCRWRVTFAAGLRVVASSGHALWQFRAPITFGEASTSGDLTGSDELARGLTTMVKSMMLQMFDIRRLWCLRGRGCGRGTGALRAVRLVEGWRVAGQRPPVRDDRVEGGRKGCQEPYSPRLRTERVRNAMRPLIPFPSQISEFLVG